MKTTYYYLKTTLAMFCLVIVITGCKKLVEINAPTNTISTAAVYGSDIKVNSVMSGLYSQMINEGMSFSAGATTYFAALSADEVVNFSGTQDLGAYNLYTNNINASTDLTTGAIWSSAYKTIYNANGVIENLTSDISAKITDSLRTHYTGEAKFIRAFCYFYLTNFYGDVPLVLSTDFNKTSLLPRTSQAQIYTQIIQDLKDAQALLPGDYSAGLGERIRANKWAATALLARVYLYQKDWKNAETQAGMVISNPQFKLLPVLDSVFNKNSEEAIWQLKQDVTVTNPANATFDGINFSTRSQWEQLGPDDQAAFLDPTLYEQYGIIFIPANYLTDGLYYAFEEGDKRKLSWVRSTPSPNVSPYNGFTYNYPFKYTLSYADIGKPAPQYYVMFRLAEQYLIRAEARAQQGNTGGAASDINIIRTRAGLPGTQAGGQADILNAIAQERRVELFAEWGHRWFDLKRTGKATEILGAIKAKQPWKPDQLLYPIPVTEIVKDPRLIQNAGY